MRTPIRLLRPRSLALFVLAMACTDSTSPPDGDPNDDIVVSPGQWALLRGEEVRFAAQSPGGGQPTVSWHVNGVAGGNATVGTIDNDGTYHAPAALPADSVVITAVSQGDPARSGSAPVFFIPPGTTNEFRILLPRVVDAAAPTPTRILLRAAVGITRVEFVLEGGASLPVTAIGGGIHTVVVPASVVLDGYVPGTLHSFAGYVDEYDVGNVRVRRLNTFVNVRDAALPAVAITPLAADAQRSPYLLNLRLDSLTIYPSPAIVTRALQALGSGDVDFLAVIATVSTANNRAYFQVRNDVQGIGDAIFDHSATMGGSPRLQGLIGFPIDAFFDGAATATSHEIGHRWINFATHDPLTIGRPHWRPSSMASGVMGFSLGTGAGGTFPWQLVPLGDGTVRAEARSEAEMGRFDALDLYLMGLLPADEVPPRFLLDEALAPNAMVAGQVYPVTTYTISEYIAHHGARVPSSATAQRDFSLATVILSAGRLLTVSEMTFFDHAARRGETLVPLPSRSGFVTSDAPGFHQATGGRATLRTALP